MNFSDALNYIKMGKRLRRKPWPVGQYVALDPAGYITFRERHHESGFIFNRYMAHVTDVDLLSEDWELYA